jgi:hypothetical protein
MAREKVALTTEWNCIEQKGVSSTTRRPSWLGLGCRGLPVATPYRSDVVSDTIVV